MIDADASRHATHLAGASVLLLQRFGGDGTFPVFGEFMDGEPIAVRVNLDPPMDDDTDD